MKKTLVSIVLLFSTTFTYGQLFSKQKKLSINYTYTYILSGNDTVKIKRTPQSEWNKLSSIDNNLLTNILQVESYLQQRKSGVHSTTWYNKSNEIEVYMSNLSNCAKMNNVYLDLTDYKNELTYYKNYPVKSQEEKRQEAIKRAEDEGMEKYRKDKEDKEKLAEYNRAIGRRNDSINAVDKRQKKMKDSIAEINYQRDIEKQKEEDLLAQKHFLEQNKKDKLVREEKEKQRRIKLIEKYGYKNGEYIFIHQVKIGWTKEMCIDAWGKPIDINKTTVSNGIHEQWVYSLKKYLYFDNGILTAIQE
jgi:hypothetical protein